MSLAKNAIDAYNQGNREWQPCTEEVFDNFLNAVPPLRQLLDSHVCSEPYTTDDTTHEFVYICCKRMMIDMEWRYFVRLATIKEFDEESIASTQCPDDNLLNEVLGRIAKSVILGGFLSCSLMGLWIDRSIAHPTPAPSSAVGEFTPKCDDPGGNCYPDSSVGSGTR